MLLLLGAGGSACSQVGYLAHVGVGQMRVLRAREKLTPARIARLSSQERQGLATLERSHAYGASLGLSHSTSFRHLIERTEQESIRVVVAAPPNRLEPVTWWFPIVGRVAYRGYFDPEAARAFAESLAQRGLDTYIRTALLYSTLGWFDDPIPRALLSWEPVDILVTIVHELVHETIFVKGDTAYNEALATLIAHHAALDYFGAERALVAAARDRFADQRRFAELLADLSRDLEALYRRTPTADEARRSREAVFRRYQQELYPSLPWRTQRYDEFTRAELSNAYILANQTYLGDLPCFEAELAELGGDLRALVREHRAKPGRHKTEEECKLIAPEGEARWASAPMSS
jgi:predicted aminopeptidase